MRQKQSLCALCRIDDGLELRKAAFECMDMLVDACPDRLSFPAFLTHLETGLKVRCSMTRPPTGLHGYYLSCARIVRGRPGWAWRGDMRACHMALLTSAHGSSIRLSKPVVPGWLRCCVLCILPPPHTTTPGG